MKTSKRLFGLSTSDSGGRKAGETVNKPNANAKYPAWVFELYARYFELLAPDEEALSIDEYAEVLGFKNEEPTK